MSTAPKSRSTKKGVTFETVRKIALGLVWRIHPVAITRDGQTIAYTTSRQMSRLYVYTGLR